MKLKEYQKSMNYIKTSKKIEKKRKEKHTLSTYVRME